MNIVDFLSSISRLNIVLEKNKTTTENVHTSLHAVGTHSDNEFDVIGTLNYFVYYERKSDG